jgi:hypothetical protein
MKVIMSANLFKTFHKVKKLLGIYNLDIGVATSMLSSADYVMVEIVCANYFWNVWIVIKLYSGHEKYMFLHWTIECGPDLQGCDLIIMLYQWCHNGHHFCQVILKILQRFKSYGADNKCRLFIMKWRLFNIWPLSRTLTFGDSNSCSWNSIL